METSKFDIADYLDSNEMIAEYLNSVLAEFKATSERLKSSLNFNNDN